MDPILQWARPALFLVVVAGVGIASVVFGTDPSDVLVEAHGLVFDILLFGFVIHGVDRAREARRVEREAALRRETLAQAERDGHDARIRGWQEQLEDLQGWEAPEAAFRNVGLVRRLVRGGATIHAPQAYLAGASLDDVDLSGASLVGARLARARLKGGCLARADLRGADLTGASLRDADLTDARLTRTILADAVLDGADLSGAWRRDDDPPIPGWPLVDGRLTRGD